MHKRQDFEPGMALRWNDTAHKGCTYRLSCWEWSLQMAGHKKRKPCHNGHVPREPLTMEFVSHMVQRHRSVATGDVPREQLRLYRAWAHQGGVCVRHGGYRGVKGCSHECCNIFQKGRSLLEASWCKVSCHYPAWNETAPQRMYLWVPSPYMITWVGKPLRAMGKLTLFMQLLVPRPLFISLLWLWTILARRKFMLGFGSWFTRQQCQDLPMPNSGLTIEQRGVLWGVRGRIWMRAMRWMMDDTWQTWTEKLHRSCHIGITQPQGLKKNNLSPMDHEWSGNP